MKKLLYLSTTLLALLFSFTQVHAEELVISGNGEGSTNQVNLSTTSETAVEQTNTADIENTVENTANTGENSASDNSGGDVAISTGDITSDTSVENSGNVSVVDGGCCPASGELEMTISGNGAESQNTIDTTTENTTTVTITQNATIDNYITTYANTGNNTANDNTTNSNGGAGEGDLVSITTGDVTVYQTVENTFINLARVSAAGPEGLWPGGGDVTIKIVNNGAYSENKIFPKWFSDIFISVHNTTNIANVLSTLANTGGNSANGNNGDVAITTGDIEIGVRVKNGPINTSIVDISCCPGKDEEPPFDPGNPTTPPVGGPTQPASSNGGGGGGGNGSSGGGNGGDVGQALGAILPVTGFNWFLATIANVLMFLFGLYLRRRSGNSPGNVYLLAA